MWTLTTQRNWMFKSISKRLQKRTNVFYSQLFSEVIYIYNFPIMYCNEVKQIWRVGIFRDHTFTRVCENKLHNYDVQICSSLFFKKKLKMELAINNWPGTFTYLHSVWLECLANLQCTELCGLLKANKECNLILREKWR